MPVAVLAVDLRSARVEGEKLPNETSSVANRMRLASIQSSGAPEQSELVIPLPCFQKTENLKYFFGFFFTSATNSSTSVNSLSVRV